MISGNAHITTDIINLSSNQLCPPIHHSSINLPRVHADINENISLVDNICLTQSSTNSIHETMNSAAVNNEVTHAREDANEDENNFRFKFDQFVEVTSRKIESLSTEIHSLKAEKSNNTSECLIVALQKEIQNLKKENEQLRERNVNISFIMSDLHTKVKDVEDEKKSLITAIKLLQADFDNNINKPVHIESDDIPKDADEAFLVTSNSNPKHVVSFNIFSVLDDNVDGRDQEVKGDLSAIKVSQPTQTETLNSYMIQPKRNVQSGGKGKNNFQLKQNTPILHQSIRFHVPFGERKADV